MNYRFEPLLDAGQQVVKQALPGEYAMEGANLIFNASDSASQGKYAIYRRVPHEDTSCEVAFARMCAAWRVADGSKLNVCETYLAKCELEKRFLNGERSPELTASMQALTEKMKGST